MFSFLFTGERICFFFLIEERKHQLACGLCSESQDVKAILSAIFQSLGLLWDGGPGLFVRSGGPACYLLPYFKWCVIFKKAFVLYIKLVRALQRDVVDFSCVINNTVDVIMVIIIMIITIITIYCCLCNMCLCTVYKYNLPMQGAPHLIKGQGWIYTSTGEGVGGLQLLNFVKAFKKNILIKFFFYCKLEKFNWLNCDRNLSIVFSHPLGAKPTAICPFSPSVTSFLFCSQGMNM